MLCEEPFFIYEEIRINTENPRDIFTPFSILEDEESW